MKIISFGDIHEDISRLSQMKQIIESADLVIISGDITNCHGKKHAEPVLSAVKKLNNQVYAQYGNMDTQEVNSYLTDTGVNLHGKGYLIENVGIFGCGASSPTPFNTPSEITEDEIAANLLKGFNMIKDAQWKIMVCHTPPKDTAIDRISNGMHVGSTAARNFIEQHKPHVCISGHIHEAKGKDKIGDTVVLNAGMFRDGWYIEIDCNEKTCSANVRSIA
ncbi:MAG: serine/threonine protein phosphatase [Candidatus Kuenenia sp.]|nr:serine/threonine protein phosphatase [Candidatus Kuenenia hertensis]